MGNPALAAGTKIGPYDVAAPLGAGGMGEVYRARDARLSRDVAIKVLPASFAAEAERLRRFEQEARATGLLNHPNILQVYDVGTHAGAPYLVSELLEGETLRERIGGTAVPVRKAIDLGVQIARGLAAAHQKGIIHRDLKPDNVFVTTDGRVKILDFGLAKLAPGEALVEAETNTRGAPGTDAGSVLGTVGYMSPEQVRARPVDHRSDIFSFGSVLYEMLTGQRAFRGASAVETMNAILKEDPPDLSASNRHLPPGLERIVAHCLEKNPDERFQSASDIAFDLEQLSGSQTQAGLVAPAVASQRPWLRMLAGGLAIACVAAGAGAFLAGRRAATPPPQFRLVTFREGTVGRASYAPDGRTIVYSARWGATDDIYAAQPGTPESRSLGLPGAGFAGVSRNGEMAVLLARGPVPGRTLARLPLSGGAPRDVTEHIVDADWAADGASLAVLRVERGSGTIEYPIGTPLYTAPFVTTPRVSPAGDLVAFADHPVVGDNRGDVAVVDRAGKKRTLSRAWKDVRGLAWAPDGREVWFTATRNGVELNLWAVTLDGKERQVYSAPGNLALQQIHSSGNVLLTVARPRPTLVGRAPGETGERDLSWLDWPWPASLSRDGKTMLFAEQGDGGGPGYSAYLRGTDGSAPMLLGKGNALALSPDGRFALVHNLAPPEHLELVPTGAGDARALPRGTLSQIHAAAFFPDGRRIAISANEEGRPQRVFVQDLTGGDPRPAASDGASFTGFVGSDPFTPEGRAFVALSESGIVIQPVDGGAPRPVNGSQAGDLPLRFGNDGRSLYVRGFVRGQGNRVPARVYRIDLATGTRELWRELAPVGAPGFASIGTIVIAPDADAYAYTSYLPLTTLYEVTGLR